MCDDMVGNPQERYRRIDVGLGGSVSHGLVA